jgi:hypothetical protein
MSSQSAPLLHSGSPLAGGEADAAANSNKAAVAPAARSTLPNPEAAV